MASHFNLNIRPSVTTARGIQNSVLKRLLTNKWLCILYVSAFITQSRLVQAQTFPLQIQVNVMPPYSAYLQDYPGTGQQVRVFILNTSRTTYQVRLTGHLTGDNGIEIRTSPNYRPPRPVTVPPGQTLLTRNDLEGLFDLNQIDVTGIDKNLLSRGFPLPDGTYQLCVRAYNETPTNTATTAFGQPLSAEFPIGCSAPITIQSVEPPILIAPLCDAEITATTPQSVVFTWTPPAGVSPASVEYVLRVVELPQVDVDPNVYIDALALPKSGVEVRGLRTSTFLYGPTQPPLTLGKRYAWRVQAIDRLQKLNFQNDGKSPVCAFIYGNVPISLQKPGVELVQTPIKVLPIISDPSTITQPAGATAVAMKLGGSKSAVIVPCMKTSSKPTEYEVGSGQKVTLTWEPNVDFMVVLAKSLNVYTTDSAARQLLSSIPNAGYQIQITDSKSGTVVSKLTTNNESISFDPVDPQLVDPTKGTDYRLKYNTQYTYRVSLELPANTLAQMKLPSVDMLTSPACAFSLKQGEKKDGFLVRGQVRYQFDGKPGVYPANNTGVKIVFGPNMTSSGKLGKSVGDFDTKPGVKQTGKVGKLDKPGSSSSQTPAAPTADTELAYYGQTNDQGIYEIPIPWEDIPKLLTYGVSSPTITASQSGTVTTMQATPTTLKYRLSLPDGYYQDNTETQTLFYLPNSLSTSVGNLTVNVYGYDLKVLVTKDFNTYYTASSKTNTQASVISGTTEKTVYNPKIEIDKSINQAVVGIEMHLYRKKKDKGIPAIEGQIGQGLAQPDNVSYILVAKGKTASETSQDGTLLASVTFDRLICQIKAGDEYYLTAQPDPKLGIAKAKSAYDPTKKGQDPTLKNDLTTDDSTAIFAAPEDTVLVKVPKTNYLQLAQSYFSSTHAYKLRSILPPTAKISGRLMYAWPDQKEKFVMANMKFSVRVGYAVYMPSEDASKPAERKQIGVGSLVSIGNVTYKNADGTTKKIDIDADNGMVAGTGTTNADGTFSLDVASLNYKGNYDNVSGNFANLNGKGSPKPNYSAEVNTKLPGGQLEIIKNRLTDPDNPWESVASKYSDYSYQNLGQLDMSNGVTLNMAGSPSQYQDKMQVTKGAFNPGAAFNVNQNVGNKAATSAKEKSVGKGGPAPDDAFEAELEDGQTYKLTRFFYFVLESPLYKNGSVLDEVLVNAFENKPLGEVVCEVNKLRQRIVVYKSETNPKYTEAKKQAKYKPVSPAIPPRLPVAIAGARVIVFRDHLLDHNPEKEGDGTQKVGPLPTASYIKQVTVQNGQQTYPGPDPVRWYADATTDGDGVVNFEKLNLINGGHYYYYVLPNETSGENLFEARIGTYSDLRFEKSDVNIDDANTPPNYYNYDEARPLSTFTDPMYNNDTGELTGLDAMGIAVKSTSSRLIVKLVDSTTSKGIKGVVFLRLNDNGKEDTYSVENGYAEIGLANYFTKGDAASKSFILRPFASGYKAVTGKNGLFTTEKIDPEGSQYLITIKMLPAATVTGRVMGHKMKQVGDKFVEQNIMVGIPAYVRRLKDDYVKPTDSDGNFTMDVTSGEPQQIVIEPNDIGYEYDTLSIPSIKSDNNYDFKVITVNRVKHRMKFTVSTASGPLAQASVQVNDKFYTTGTDGIALVDFENVSVDNYLVNIVPPLNSGAIPQSFEVKNKETKTYVPYNVLLKLGAKVVGTVRLDGKLVAGAKVYLDYQTSVNDKAPALSPGGSNTSASGETNAESLIRTITALDGSFTLVGIPVDNANITLRATMSVAGKTIIGDAQKVQIIVGKGTPTAHFNLTTYDKMLVQSVYGFPLTVETLEPKSDGTAVVTGQVRLRSSQASFNWLPGGEVVRIRNVSFKPVSGAGGSGQVGTPVANSVELDGLAQLKFKHLGQYNVQVTNVQSDPKSTPVPLVLTATSEGRGQLKGRVQVVDNSFNYPSTYLSFSGKGSEDFYLANSVTSKPGAKLTTGLQPVDDSGNYVVDNLITVLSATTADAGYKANAIVVNTPGAGTKYYLTDRTGGSVKFDFLRVPSYAVPTASFIDPSDKKFHLNIGMNFHIEHSQPEDFTVNLDEIILDDQTIKPKDVSKPLELKFEDWTLRVKNYTLSPQEGGIVCTDKKNILLNTQQVDIPFEKFTLRSDLFLLETPSIQNLNVGGLATLYVSHPQNAVFAYDVMFSGEGHWKLGIFGSDTEPAGTLVLDKLTPGTADASLLRMVNKQTGQVITSQPTQIAFDYIQLLSKGENILSIKPDQEFRIQGNNLASFTPGGFSSTSNSMSMLGTFAIKDAPRTPSTALSIDYKKSGNSTYSSIGADWTIEVKGHTKFTANPGPTNLTINATDIVVAGTVEEEGASPKLTAKFHARSTAKDGFPYWIQVDAQTVNSLASTFNVDVIDCRGAQADTHDWKAPLAFIGEVYDSSPTATIKKTPAGTAIPYSLFTVYGNMHVKSVNSNSIEVADMTKDGGNLKISDKGIQFDGLKTPFGTLALSYSNGALRGSLDISKNNDYIKLGAFKVKGQGSMLIDKDGFYIVASVAGESDYIPPPIQGVTLGIALGKRKYEDDVKVLLRGTSKDPTIDCKVGESVAGIFLGGGVTLFHKEIDYDFVAAEGWATADVSLFASSKMDLSKKDWTFSAGAVAAGDIGVRILCAKASADVRLWGDMSADLAVDPVSLCIGGTIGAEFSVGVDACGVAGYHYSKTLALVGSISVSTTGKKVDFDFVNSDGGANNNALCDRMCPCQK